MHRRQFLFTIASSLTGVSTLSATVGVQEPGEWQEATSTQIDYPQGLAVDSSGQLYIAEAYGRKILVLDTPAGKIRPVAGGGSERIIAGAEARSIELDWPTAVAISEKGQLWVVDHLAESVMEIDVRSGRVTKVIGGAQDRQARVNYPNGIAITPGGEIYITDWVMGSHPPDSRDHGVFRLDPSTIRLTRITGVNAPIKIDPGLLFPYGMAFNSSGLFYVSDYENNRILECNLADRSVRTLVNILSPRGLALDGDNTLYSTEATPRVQAVDLRTGEVRVVAGRGTRGFSGDGGPATAAEMVSPFGLAVDRQGNLFISDSYDNRIRKIDANSGVISTVAGNGSPVRQGIEADPH